MGSQEHPLSRRRFVQLSGASSALVLAGCLGDGDSDGGDGGSGDDGSGDDGSGDDGSGDSNGDDGSGDDGSGDDGSGGGEEQYVEVGLSSSIRTLDPIRYLSTPDRQILNQAFDPIIGIDPELEYYPALAASMPEVEREGQRWIVEIDPDAKFQNGDPVTLDDIRYTVEQPIAEERGSTGDFQMIEEISEVDDNTLQFDLDSPYPRFMLSLNVAQVVPEDVREENKGDEWEENFVGSGPFQIVDVQQGEGVTLERWDDYWGEEQPNLDEIVFNSVTEPSTRVTTLQTGESDLVQEIPSDLYSTVEGIDGAELMTTESLRCNFIAFNCMEGPTADPRVREAIDYTIDIEQEVDLIYGESAERMYSPFPPMLADSWDFPTDEWAEIPHGKDIDAAQQLLEEADVDTDYEFKILISGADREDMAVSLSNGIEEAGYTASVQNLEWETFIQTFATGSEDDMNIYLLGLSGEPDPGSFAFTLYHQSREGLDNGHYYRDEELTEWLEAGDETSDREERREIYIDAVTRVLEERVHLPTQVPLNSWGAANYVSDFQVHPQPSKNPQFLTDYTNVSANR